MTYLCLCGCRGPPSEYKQLKDRIIRELRRDGGRCLTKVSSAAPSHGTHTHPRIVTAACVCVYRWNQVVISRLKLKKGDAKTKLVGDILKEVATLSAPQKDGLKYLIIKVSVFLSAWSHE